MKRSVLDCFRRGVLSTRANWPLILVAMLQSVVVTVLFVVSLLPPFVVLGGQALFEGLAGGGLEDPAAVNQWLLGLGEEVATRLGALALSLLASFLLGLLAIVVWAWFQGGIAGVLVGAERQARADAQNRPGGWLLFRTFSWRDFTGWGGRNLWRFFWFFHLVITAWTVFALVFTIFVVATGVAWEAWGGGAGFGLGCGGAIPVAFLFWVLFAWSVLAQPAVALPESGAWRGSVLGFQVLGQRLGAASLLLLLMFVISVVFSLGITLGRTAVGLLLGDALVWTVALYAVAWAVQTVAASTLKVFLLAAYTALVGAQVPPEALSSPAGRTDAGTEGQGA